MASPMQGHCGFSNASEEKQFSELGTYEKLGPRKIGVWFRIHHLIVLLFVCHDLLDVVHYAVQARVVKCVCVFEIVVYMLAVVAVVVVVVVAVVVVVVVVVAVGFVFVCMAAVVAVYMVVVRRSYEGTVGDGTYYLRCVCVGLSISLLYQYSG